MASRDVQQQYKAVSKTSDVKQDLLTVMAPHANWEEYLTPAPISIALIGQLMKISTKQDFSLEGSKPENGWAPIRNPKSFRACLQQVANDGYDAFSVAHKNMDGIRLSTLKVPDILKTALEILFNGEPEDIQEYLPVELRRIDDASKKCLKRAQEVEKKFNELMDLTGKLLEVYNAAKGDHEEKLKETKAQKIAKEQKRKELEERKKEQKKREDDVKKSMQRAEDDYFESKENLPGGWGMIWMNAVENISNNLNALGRVITLQPWTNSGGHSGGSDGPSGGKKAKYEDQDVFQIYMRVFELKGILEALVSFVGEDKMVEVPTDKDDPGKALAYIKGKFELIEESISLLSDSKPKVELQLVNTDGAQICQSLTNFVKSPATFESKKKKKLAEQIVELDTKGKALRTQAVKFLSVPQVQSDPPVLAAQQAQRGPPKMTSQLMMEQAQLNLTTAKDMLKDTREQYDKVVTDREKTTDELLKIMEDMSKLNINEINFEETIKVLRRGIEVFSELRDKWAKLVEFFQMTSTLIEETLQDPLQTFVKYSRIEIERGEEREGYSASNFTKDLIYKRAFQGAMYCYMINIISGAYVEISGEHLMHRIAGVGKILGYDPETESDKIEAAQRELSEGCQEAQEAIREKIGEEKEKLHIKVSKRLKALESVEIPLAPEVKDRIDKAVTAGKKAVKEHIQEPSGKINIDDYGL